MKRPSRLAFIGLSLLLAGVQNTAGEDGLVLRIPLKMADASAPTTASPPILVNPALIRVQINGRNTPVLGLEHAEIDLQEESEIGRNFILSFHTLEFAEETEAVVEYFLTEILTPRDLLVLCTPQQVYSIPVSSDKGGLARRIASGVRRDLREFRQRKTASEQQLEQLVDQVKTSLEERYRWAVHHERLHHLLSDLFAGLELYKSTVLNPVSIHIRRAAEMATVRPGSCWMILFYQPNLEAFIGRLHQTLITNKSHITVLLSKILGRFREQKPFSWTFPDEDLADVSGHHNIIFHSVLTHPFKPSNDPNRRRLHDLCSRTGGLLIDPLPAKEVTAAIKTHRTRIYEVRTACPAEPDAKQVQIHVPADRTALYKSEFTPAEVSALLHPDPLITVDDIRIEQQILSLRVGSYQRNENGVGIVTVRVEIVAARGGDRRIVYAKKNTFRTHREDMTLSLPIPPVSGEVRRLRISVFDLLANTTRKVERPLRGWGRPHRSMPRIH